FAVGRSSTFRVTATGTTEPNTPSLHDALPGLMFVDHGDGTATLGGTPAHLSGGTYPIVITASNGVAPDATLGLTLNVNEAPAINTPTTIPSTTVGSTSNIAATATSFPKPSSTE